MAFNTKERKCIARAMKLIEEDATARESLRTLMTIPGIGPVTATMLIVLFRRYTNTNREQIVALAGLDPIEYRSGSSVHKKLRISKRGSREIHKRLNEVTL